jgi:hypothetical protein
MATASKEAARQLKRVLAEIAIRKAEALQIYNPLPYQTAFHNSKTLERIIRGGNRAGKTVAAAVEVARAVTSKKNQVWYVVGKDGRELAQVLWKKLGRPGAFCMIRDEVNKRWRAYDPDTDAHRSKDKRPSLPLIPRRMIKDIAYESKKEDLPKIVTLINGTKIHFYSSNASPARGADIDGAWFDEEADADRDWYIEIAARLLDRDGIFIWSATPQAGSERLYALHERALEQIEKNVTPRTVEEFFCTMDDNKHVNEEAKEAFKGKLLGDDISYDVRVKGEFALVAGRVFPEYAPKVHEIDPFPIPNDWTLYCATDPGRQVAAVLFLAIPPPEKEDHIYIYDELYLKCCDATRYGLEMKQKCQGRNFRAFLIDVHEYKKKSAGDGKTIGWHYADALEANKIKSEITGSDFLLSDGSPGAIRPSLEEIRLWLRIRSNGTPKLLVMKSCFNFIKEIKHYRYKKKPDGTFIDTPDAKNNHTIDALRYLAQHRPQWIPAKAAQVVASGAYKWYIEQKAKEAKKSGNSYMMGPGDGSARADQPR